MRINFIPSSSTVLSLLFCKMRSFERGEWKSRGVKRAGKKRRGRNTFQHMRVKKYVPERERKKNTGGEKKKEN